MPAMTAQQTAQQQMQYNALVSQKLRRDCINSWLNINSQVITTGPGTVINIPLRNVGLVKRLVVEVTATISGTAGPTHTLTTLGASNFFSNVTLTDLSNQTRINTAGWHLTAVASAKARMPFGSAITSTDTPFGYGAAFVTTQKAPATITATAASPNVFLMFEVPVSLSDNDLRGAIYAGVVNATFSLQLTINPGLFVGTGVDATLAMYQSSTGVLPTLPTCTVTTYQNFLDQIPITQQGPLLPFLDIGTSYLLNSTSFGGLVANQANPLPYANFRDFLSTTVIYDNAGVLNVGSDITSWSITTANYTNIIQVDSRIVSLWSRLRMQSDFPAGMYYFDHRDKPISTVQYGNMSLNVILASVTGAASVLLVGYESLAVQNQIVNAGSLAGS